MALFFDTFLNKLDAKGRVSVPAAFRAALNGQSFHGVLAMPSLKYSAIQCAGMDWMEELGRKVNQADFLSDEHDDLTAALFGDTKQLPFDGEGRVVLPSLLAAHAGIEDIAAFVGRGPFFEIWHPKTLETYKVEARKRALEKGRTLSLRQGDKT